MVYTSWEENNNNSKECNNDLVEVNKDWWGEVSLQLLPRQWVVLLSPTAELKCGFTVVLGLLLAG